MSKKTPRPVRLNTDSIGGPTPCDQGQVRIDVLKDDSGTPIRARISLVGFELVMDEHQNQLDVLKRTVDTYGGFKAIHGGHSGLLVDIADKVASNRDGLLPQLRALRHTLVGKLNSMHRQRTGEHKRPQAQNSPFDNAATRAELQDDRVNTASEVVSGLRDYKFYRTR